LQPLDDLFKGSTGSTGLALGDYYPAALDVCREQGKLLGVPLMAVPLLLAYDEQRFRRAAVSPPDAGWGWKELLDAARRLTPVAADAAPDQYGLVPYPASASLLALIWQNGGDVLSADKTRALLAEPRAREAIEYFTSFYATQPASPSDAFGGWEWNREGVRVNGRWWAAMTQAPNAGSLVPPMPTAASMLKQTFGEWLDSVREAFGGQAGWQSPMRFAPLPKGRQRASAMLVTATLSVARKSGNPDAAGTALALLAERVSKSVVPSARRLTTDVMKRLAPHYTPDQLQLLADSLADSRALVAGDQSRTKQLHVAVWNSLYLPIQRRTRPLDEIVDSANRAVQAVLSGP
jgi:ABC-type glycerol-3-phosphate transport system substrate-binding protein